MTPPTRQGLGTGVIADCIRNEIGGEMDYVWRPTGLVCNLVLPTSSIATLD
jgi:hypothetical protein